MHGPILRRMMTPEVRNRNAQHCFPQVRDHRPPREEVKSGKHFPYSCALYRASITAWLSRSPRLVWSWITSPMLGIAERSTRSPPPQF